MAKILNIETATSVCSVAVGINGKCVALKETNEGRTHAEFITVFIDEVIKKAGIEYKDLDAIAVSSGPGSYTGLRIGVSTAKGLCYALDKPLIAIETLKAMAYGQSKKMMTNSSLMADILTNEILLCPMIDARRMEIYTAFYNLKMEIIKPVSADIINENSYSDYLKNDKIFFFGDGAEKCKEPFKNRNNIFFYDNLFPSAEYLVSLSENKFNSKEFEDLAYFEPFYLKEVNITKPKDAQ
jgi:tRNA threonylcarbamoyladenosine biosynthesis protein TsaB